MKEFLRIFDLSKNEQRVVLIVILLLSIIAFVAYDWRLHRSPAGLAPSTQPKPSSTAVETVGED